MFRQRPSPRSRPARRKSASPLTSRSSVAVIYTTLTNVAVGTGATGSVTNSSTAAVATGSRASTHKPSKPGVEPTRQSVWTRPWTAGINATITVTSSWAEGSGTGTPMAATGVGKTCTEATTYAHPGPGSRSTASSCTTIVAGMTTIMRCPSGASGSMGMTQGCGSSSCPLQSSTDTYEATSGLGGTMPGELCMGTPGEGRDGEDGC